MYGNWELVDYTQKANHAVYTYNNPSTVVVMQLPYPSSILGLDDDYYETVAQSVRVIIFAPEQDHAIINVTKKAQFGLCEPHA